MNFKYFVIVIYLGFVSLIVMMVFKSCSQNIELESGNYYAEELQYQSRIDAKLKGNYFYDSFKVLQNRDRIKIQQAMSLESDSIKLSFMKPDSRLADKSFVFKGSRIPELNRAEFREGIYKLSISLYTAKGEYLIEKKVRL